MGQNHPVAAMTLADVVENIRLLLDSGRHDVDGITAAAAPHPALDPADAIPGENAILVTFTDSTGRNRVAEVQITRQEA